MMPARTLYVATSNAGKLAEFRAAAAAGSGMTIEALPELAEMPEPVEDASTFAGNAALKAVAYSRQVPGLRVLCDDSGLEVAALGGRPGVRSARFAEDLGFAPGAATKDKRNNQALLSLLQPGMDRKCRFVCALAVALEGAVLLQAEGYCDGLLLEQPEGDGGFGYDPLFFVPEFARTMAALSVAEKWSVSHRGRAMRALMENFPPY